METRELSRLAEHEQRWLGHAREMEGRDEMAFPRQPPAGKGGGGGDIFVVKVKKDGGSAGSASAACSLTYSLYDKAADVATATPLATLQSPYWRRAALGAYLIPSDGTYGLAFYRPDTGALTLLKALREVEDVEACT